MRSLPPLLVSWKAFLALAPLVFALPARADTRIGLGLDLFTESSRLSGHQTINTARQDESFDYRSNGFLSATLSLSIPAPVSPERARMGAGVRFFGNYGSGGEGNPNFGFGMLTEGFVSGEYGLPVADKMEAVFGARGGLALLVPGKEFSAEISRLRDQGVSAWHVPRLGWLAGISVGARRRMGEHLLLRGDFSGQLERLFLFATSQDIKGLDFDKSWNTFGLRLGLTLGIEFSL
ncbi:hypothetical protein [Hyalangium sp.]|uniref:hypothetical protein n=1 Tax=Hyalangium sp. TaxID=2028555 RepID=UPI002D636809|nr:hypothetical protein [Hyalangium sp.]HYH95286.1 hypothetical protein [Hyalangium sp.]